LSSKGEVLDEMTEGKKIKLCGNWQVLSLTRRPKFKHQNDVGLVTSINYEHSVPPYGGDQTTTQALFVYAEAVQESHYNYIKERVNSGAEEKRVMTWLSKSSPSRAKLSLRL
jgi:hypothetical protein